MERLQKVIASSGYTSRRKAEELIINGEVKVNSKVVTELGTKVNNHDIIEVRGMVLERDLVKVYYLLNKPAKVISSVKDNLNRKTVIDLIDTDKRIYPIGRLDYDTTGLLLLTNDGELTNILTHPSNKIEKTYVAQVEGLLNKEEIDYLKRGINIDERNVKIINFKIKKKDFEKLTSVVELTIIEGRNHIVKRLLKAINHPVIRLKRTRIAFLDLKDIKVGDYRKLTLKEVKRLYSLK